MNNTETNRKPDVEVDELDVEAIVNSPGVVGTEEVDSNAIGVGELQDGLGTSSTSPVPDTTHFNAVSTDALEAGSVSGDVVGRPEAIDNLEGNVYLESQGTDPGTVLENDGDIVFIHE